METVDNMNLSKTEKEMLTALLDGKDYVFETTHDEIIDDSDGSEKAYRPDELVDHLNIESLGVTDDVTYDRSPFEQIASKMTEKLHEGKLLKRILRVGAGDAMPELAEVTIEYNAYFEYSDEPFDSTYLRRKPLSFRVGQGNVLLGVDLAVKTMLQCEKSQFLIAPELAYGEFGCFERIPPNATLLYEIEIVRISNTAATLHYDNLSADEKKEFKVVAKFVLATCEKASNLIKKHRNYKAAVKEYNIAVGELDSCPLQNSSEHEEQIKLLLRLYTNLAICYNHLKLPKKVCINCNNIYRLVKGTDLDVKSKVYYNNCKALMMLGDLDAAKEKLRKAAINNVDDKDIIKTYRELNRMMVEQDRCQTLMSKALVGNNASVKEAVLALCEELKSSALHSLKLPAELNKDLKYITSIAEGRGLYVIESEHGNEKCYCVAKQPAV